MYRKGVWGFFIVLLLTGVTGCQREKDPVSPAGIKVGALFPLSGDLKDKGTDSANGVRLAAEEINNAGGIASLDGAKLEIVFADTKGKPDVGEKETERLIKEEGVVAIIGTLSEQRYQAGLAGGGEIRDPVSLSVSPLPTSLPKEAFAILSEFNQKPPFTRATKSNS